MIMKPSDLKGKKITVMGLGILGGGTGVVKFLVKHGAKVLVTDLKSRRELANSLKQLKSFRIQYVLGRHRLSDFIDSDLIIKNPAVPNDSKFLKAAARHKVPIENDASLFFQYCPVPIIGITGTKGKSTTVALLERILKKSGILVVLVGHNTTSVLDRIELIKPNCLALFELSSWRLEGLAKTKKSPWIAVVTNVLPDHLNTYRGMKEYQAAKKNIYRFQNSGDYVILNKDNEITRSFGKKVPSQRYWFSLKTFSKQNGAFVKDGKIFFSSRGKVSLVANLADLKIKGDHNTHNALAAVTVAKLLKVNNEDITSALCSFKGMPGRLEQIRVLRGVKFYNDTAATNPAATISALRSFRQKVTLIAGGQNKGLDYFPLAQEIAKKVNDLVLLPGSASNELAKHLNYLDFSFGQNDSLALALGAAYRKAKKGDIILFSPGAASFNLFKNEFDRGNKFKKIVNKLP